MSTSVLYNAFWIRGYKNVSTSYDEGQVSFHIRQPRHQLRCLSCGSNVVWSQGSVPRTFRALPIGRKPVLIHFDIPWLFCFSCRQTRQVEIAFADPRRTTRGPTSVMAWSCRGTRPSRRPSNTCS